jgi:hypothetical protein
MSLKIVNVTAPEIIERCGQALKKAGYRTTISDNSLIITQAGHADRSVDFTVRVIDLDGHRLVEFSSVLAESEESFDRVVLAVARGNTACHTVSFSPIETHGAHGKAFSVVAQSHLYAEYFSDEELVAMVYLFTRELDEVDNELREILAGH